MPIEFTCADCERPIRVKDELTGKRVKCPGCSASITVPDGQEPPPKKAPVRPAKPAPAPARRPRDEDEEDDRPRRPARGRDEDEEDRPRKGRRRDEDEEEEDDRPRKKRNKGQSGASSLPLILGIGGGVLAVAVIGLGVWWAMSGPGTKGGPPVAGKDAGKDASKDAGKDGPGSGPYATPEATWNAVVKANLAFDDRGFISGFAPEDQQFMAARQAFGLLQARFVGGARYKPVLDALDKHGLTEAVCKPFKSDGDRSAEGPMIRKLIPLIKDPVGLWADITLAHRQVEVDRKPSPRGEYQGTISNVKIEGDKATGEAAVPGFPPGATVPLSFLKVGAEWRLTLPAHMKR